VPGSANRPVQNWLTSRVATAAATTKAAAPSGEPWRLEVMASAAGSRRSRAIAKMPRDADTAQPMATASMSNSTTSSSSRSIQVPPYPPAFADAPSANSGAAAAAVIVLRS
jgi:hypothetical protein